MRPLPSSPHRAPHGAPASSHARGKSPMVAAAALAVAGLALGWLGGAWALVGGMLTMASTAYGLERHRRQQEPAQGNQADSEVSDGEGAQAMVSQVVPVWRRQLDVTRDSANEGLTQILAVFTDMSEALQTLTHNIQSSAMTAAPGAVDQAIEQESAALELLHAATARAFAQRDEAVAELARCADELLDLQHLAKQAREIARHTRMVAFNASIESSRGHDSQGAGAQAVAAEVRMLAVRMAETGEKIDQTVKTLSQTVSKARQLGEVHDTSPQELRMEIDLQARLALRAMLSAMGASVQGSAQVQQASARLRSQLDDAFVLFQFGDRVSQMLTIIGQDMNQLTKWIVAHPRATQQDATEWLAALEASYTMDEQRSNHHGNVHVERATSVEFF